MFALSFLFAHALGQSGILNTPSGISNSFDTSNYPPPYQVTPSNPAFNALYTPALVPEPDIINCATNSHFALTFDDGPGSGTRELISYLNSKNIALTFFITGTQATRFPDSLKFASDSGHEIGIHTWSHTSLLTLSDGQVVAEIEWTSRIIQEITGKKPKFFRPPYGDIDDRIRKIVNGMGLKSVLWGLDTQDYLVIENLQQNDINQIVGKVTEVVLKREGIITVSHDLYPAAPRLATSVVEAIERGGMKIVTMSECVAGGGTGGNNGSDTSNYPPAYQVTPSNPVFNALYTPALVPEPDIINCATNSHFALTFDDGPSSGTRELVQYLNSKNIAVTFFVTGTQAIQFPDILKFASDSGHEIGIHTWSHTSLPTLSDGQVVAEIEWTSRIIQEITGKKPNFFRPPYGNIDDRIRKIVNGMGLKTTLWGFDTKDYLVIENLQENDINQIVGKVTEVVLKREGVITLAHDLYPAAPRLAKSVVEAIERGGMRIVTIRDCLAGNGDFGVETLSRTSRIAVKGNSLNFGLKEFTNGEEPTKFMLVLSIVLLMGFE